MLGVLGWQWRQLDHMQTICTLLQTGNHTNTSSLNFYRPSALPDTQPTVSKHWRQTEVIVIIWHTVLLVDFNAVEFFNGHNTDKAHPFIEDCIAKQQPLVKVTTVCDLPCLPCSLLHIQPLYRTSGCLLVVWLSSYEGDYKH